jgi:hypothetical protein
MLSKIQRKSLESLSLRELEDLIQRKRQSQPLAELIKERDRLRLELHRVEGVIAEIERSSPAHGEEAGAQPEAQQAGEGAPKPQSFLAGKRRRNLKDYIAQVLLDADEALSPTDIQQRLSEVGYVSHSTNPRSFYNTVFQALQRYDIFSKEGRKYRLASDALQSHGVKEILPKKKTRLKDYIIEVLGKSEMPLKASEIASRVVIEGYVTDLEMEELIQRVSATLKKYLNRDFDWDSQRYRLAQRN